VAASSTTGPTTTSAPSTSSSPPTTSRTSSGSTSSSSGTPTTTPSSLPSGTSVCPVDPTTKTPVTVDVLNETGDHTKGDTAEADVTRAGLTFGDLRSSAATAPSAIEYPAALEEQARQLATDLGQTALLVHNESVRHLTLVLGPSDSTPLLDALHRAAASPVC
jgi:hypothetical protein